MVFQFIATPSAELEYVSDRDGGFKQPLESCKLLTRWALKYFDQPGHSGNSREFKRFLSVTHVLLVVAIIIWEGRLRLY